MPSEKNIYLGFVASDVVTHDTYYILPTKNKMEKNGGYFMAKILFLYEMYKYCLCKVPISSFFHSVLNRINSCQEWQEMSY